MEQFLWYDDSKLNVLFLFLTRKGDKERKKLLILVGKIKWDENENYYLLW